MPMLVLQHFCHLMIVEVCKGAIKKAKAVSPRFVAATTSSINAFVPASNPELVAAARQRCLGSFGIKIVGKYVTQMPLTCAYRASDYRVK